MLEKILAKEYLIAEHYQNTFELTYKLWEQRNRYFLLLVIAVGLAALLTLNPSQTSSLLENYVITLFEKDSLNPATVDFLKQMIPVSIHVISLTVVLYLMLTLYHRTVTIIRHYKYMGHLEEELRGHLKLRADSYAFTREGTFYRQYKSRFMWTITICYIGILGSLLGGLYYLRIYEDLQSGDTILLSIDIFMAVFTGLFFLGYALPSLVAMWSSKLGRRRLPESTDFPASNT